jgi:hypothetical protein
MLAFVDGAINLTASILLWRLRVVFCAQLRMTVTIAVIIDAGEKGTLFSVASPRGGLLDAPWEMFA